MKKYNKWIKQVSTLLKTMVYVLNVNVQHVNYIGVCVYTYVVYRHM